MADNGRPDEFSELVAAARRLPYGDARLELLQQAVRVADTRGDVELGYRTRRELIHAAAMCLRYDAYAAAFSWCFATAQAHPDRFPAADLLRTYQDVIGKVVNFPDITRAQYEGLFADVVKHFRAHGFSLRTAYLERRSVAADFGDPAMAREADREWRKHPRDALSAERDFEHARQLEHECFLGDDAAAVRAADRYFARRDRNHGYDAWVSGYAIVPLWRVGRREDAAARYELGARSFRATGGYMWHWGYHLEYLGLVGDWARGVRTFEAHLPVAMRQTDPLSRFYFLRPAAVLLDRLAAAGVGRVTLRVPDTVPWRAEEGVYEVEAVRRWVRETAVEIAARFDRRNGNTHYSDLLRRGA